MIGWRAWLVLAAVAVVLTWAGGLGRAQAQGNMFNGDPIAQIRVEGTQRVDPETVRSYMQIVPGDTFTTEKINLALKYLFATGLFADVVFEREEDTLVARVVENPIINRVAFEGNDSLEDEVLDLEVQLRPRVVFTQTRVQSDVRRILEIYRRSGRFAATVEPKVIKLEQNRIDLVFEIDEGPVTGIASIDFVGNNVFSDGELRDEISTQESAWYRFLIVSDRYDPDRLTVDREALRNFYLREGYADFRVASAVAELAPDRGGFYITFTVEEGERYKFGKIDIGVTIKNVDVEALRGQITTVEGDWYNASQVEKTIAGITLEVGTLGYAFVEVAPQIARDQEALTIDIVYEVQEGPRVYVERIDIENNIRSLDEVIRREFRLVEGDAFNTTKERRTRQRIQNLGFFSRVDIKNVPGSAPDRTKIIVEVEERPTGEITFGVGFSTAEGPLGNISVRERNLLGRGQDLRLDFSLSGVKSQLLLSFTEPYFLDKNMSAGFDVYRTVTDRDESSFDEERIGAGVRTGYDVSEFVRHSVKYNLTRNDVTNVSASASPSILEQEGVTLNSVIGHELLYDKRDTKFNTSEGHYVRLRQDAAGLGGDVRYVNTRLGAGYYLPITELWVASVTGELGYLFGLGDDVRINDSFFIGGTTLRGFASGGIGPRDELSDDSLGGKQYAVGSVELGFPLPIPDEYQIRGRIFSDFGTLYDTDAQGLDVVDEIALRASVGAGISWTSPFGPLQVDLAFPFLKEDYDQTEFFRFNAGTTF
jgi:outer membrane protein insertion porin family